jgi:hypothetical protein
MKLENTESVMIVPAKFNSSYCIHTDRIHLICAFANDATVHAPFEVAKGTPL